MLLKVKDYLTTKITPTVFYVLSWTWGVIMSLIGVIVVSTIVTIGKKEIQKHGLCYYVEVGKGWGGLELGMFFICSEGSSESTKSHEFGHGLQNCILGPFMPFVVCIPSAVRYWYRRIRSACGKVNTTPYDAIWFEGSATELGTQYMRNH